MRKIKKEWHAKNRMPKNPTPGQRIEWDVEHGKNSARPEMPREIALEVQKLQTSDIPDKEKRDREGYLKQPQTRDELLRWE